MIIEVDRPAGEFRKRAETPEEAARLSHEAHVLTVARHPGVVELLRRDGPTLALRLVDAEPLAADTALVAVPVGVAVATTLADLHDLGVVHGALSPDHILVDRSGRPTLCSFGRGAIDAAPDGEAAARDVVALARALLTTSTEASATTTRILTMAAKGGRKPPSARELAALLADTPPPRRRLPRAVPVALAACTVIGAIAFLSAGQPVPAGACPAVDRGCQPIPRSDGVVETPSGRFRIGRPDDVLVVGRWQCGAALPALLRPTTGEIWVWDAWARAGDPLTARLAGRIPDAVTLRVDPDGAGCDGLRVLRHAGGAVVVHPGRPA
ncbi:MAG: eukaryotic-like serine/threonine-protein kinase [Acidimicrobiaceae bacterium]|nr:eukaryotic-like serine/threonine-protein kinase [Acidimicrobiaceae bacterium]